ncbi:MAG: hypothetical protein OXO51_12445 [Gemmatimonadota bacterium]|nr:hypothetical protein [Gemmatimonadota bacterium]
MDHDSVEAVSDTEHRQEPAADDFKAADSLEMVLDGLEELDFVPISLREWKEQSHDILHDAKAENTLVLFDRDFRREEPASENEGLLQIREAQCTNVGYYGLISHTVPLGGENEAWIYLAKEFDIVPHRFLVIAKERLKKEPPDYYGFLGMLRLTALSGRYERVKCKAWSIFEDSLSEAREAMDRLPVLDFDRMFFASSRREGVWEPETLFRVFSILMRRDARARMHRDQDIINAISEARSVSTTSDLISRALETENDSMESVRLQRFEIYEPIDELNSFHTPVNIGDVYRFESKSKDYILLAQPCDLMVRGTGKRNYDDNKFGRTAAVVELVNSDDEKKESWGELPFCNEETGKPVFVNYARVYQVPLLVLDLCTFSNDGMAKINVCEECPQMLIEPWKERYRKLCRHFEEVLNRYSDLTNCELDDETNLLALPGSANTLKLKPEVADKTLKFGVKRVLRLRQPWSGALLTEFAQYHARAAFDHYFGHPVESPTSAD